MARSRCFGIGRLFFRGRGQGFGHERLYRRGERTLGPTPASSGGTQFVIAVTDAKGPRVGRRPLRFSPGGVRYGSMLQSAQPPSYRSALSAVYLHLASTKDLLQSPPVRHSPAPRTDRRDEPTTCLLVGLGSSAPTPSACVPCAARPRAGAGTPFVRRPADKLRFRRHLIGGNGAQLRQLYPRCSSSRVAQGAWPAILQHAQTRSRPIALVPIGA